jgi:hypothetical protein
MPYFTVMVEGRGLQVPPSGDGQPIVGFFTHRVVSAHGPVEARKKAVQVLEHEWSSPPLSSMSPTRPSLSVQEVSALSIWQALFGRRPKGFTFFSSYE